MSFENRPRVVHLPALNCCVLLVHSKCCCPIHFDFVSLVENVRHDLEFEEVNLASQEYNPKDDSPFVLMRLWLQETDLSTPRNFQMLNNFLRFCNLIQEASFDLHRRWMRRRMLRRGRQSMIPRTSIEEGQEFDFRCYQ